VSLRLLSVQRSQPTTQLATLARGNPAPAQTRFVDADHAKRPRDGGSHVLAEDVVSIEHLRPQRGTLHAQEGLAAAESVLGGPERPAEAVHLPSPPRARTGACGECMQAARGRQFALTLGVRADAGVSAGQPRAPQPGTSRLPAAADTSVRIIASVHEYDASPTSACARRETLGKGSTT